MGGFDGERVGQIGGGIAGSFIPVPGGTAIGAKLGGKVGGAIDGGPAQPGQIGPQPQPQGAQPQPGAQQQIGEQDLAQLLLLLSQIFGQISPTGGGQQ